MRSIRWACTDRKSRVDAQRAGESPANLLKSEPASNSASVSDLW